MTSTTAPPDPLPTVIADAVEPHAIEVDRIGRFPTAALAALGQAGLLGLVSARDVGGRGEGLPAAVEVVRELARHCASTAMIACMHYAAVAVIEAHGPQAVRRRIAAGEHLATLAFSEAGSRSHFWAPVGTATVDGAQVRLDASKSWVTSAGVADSYVWSSLPLDGDGASSLWLVPSDSAGLKVVGSFDGLGLRGNESSPVLADGVLVSGEDQLGEDGQGFDLMMSIVLPWFSLMNAAFSVGIMEAATAKAAAHVGRIRFEHLGDRLADLPTIRAYIARMRIETDQAYALLTDTVDAVASGRDDAQLRVLEVKAAASEAATQVTELGMRVCGGAAFRKDLGIERHFRDARAATVMAPTTDVLYDLIGRATCGLPLFSTEEGS
jgi:alkylation response protein AidB-like acyl-CoA dehydrogenase